MPSVADAWMRLHLRVDKKEAEKSLKQVDTKSAGKKGGAEYSKGFLLGAQPKRMSSRLFVRTEAKAAGTRAGTEFSYSFRSTAGKLLSAAGPGILGIGLKGSGILLGGGLAAGMVPALVAGLGAGVTAAGGLGAILLGGKTLIGTKKAQGPLYAVAQQAGKTFQDGFQKGVAPLAPALRQVFAQVPRIMAALLPGLKAVFSGAATLVQ